MTDLACSGFCDVDLVFLYTEDIVLKYEAVRQNRLIYSTPDFDRGSMYSRVVREYLDFVSDPEHYGSAERFLHLAIEATLDMGNHVIAESDLGIVNWYSDIPSILARKGYIDDS